MRRATWGWLRLQLCTETGPLHRRLGCLPKQSVATFFLMSAIAGAPSLRGCQRMWLDTVTEKGNRRWEAALGWEWWEDGI
uniref:Uncharacterized protein n=1 Tax=Oryza sativa subsp. japonica TaxID=39947 RepID=Q8LHS8_ORYSJ|nr:hypothetical protein [Oryza sativa Japonica Group]BAC66215.1 hypothetical protein [Oryza sativa Japonica Group]